MKKLKPRNYHAKHMIINRIGKTKVIPNKKKNSEEELSIEEYLEELEDDLDIENQLD